MPDDIHNVAKQIFVNPTVATRIVNLVTSNKPVGWSSRSNAPYFKKIYADEIKPYIDQMMIDKQDIIYRYSVWCTDETNMTPQTVYNRVNMSIRYILDPRFGMDTDHTYADWYELVHVARVKGLGVVISYIPGFGNNDNVNLKPESVSPKETKPLWYRKMDDWLEDVDNFEPYVKENLALSESEIVDLKIRLSGLSNIQSSITESKVAIIRIS
jgi:hypothetical protein